MITTEQRRTLTEGTRVRVIGNTSPRHYVREGEVVTVEHSGGEGSISVRVDASSWTPGSGYGGRPGGQFINPDDLEVVVDGPTVTLDEFWRPPVGTPIVIIAGHRDSSDSYHGFALGSTVTVETLDEDDDDLHIVARGETRYSTNDTQYLRPGDYRLPDGVTAILPGGETVVAPTEPQTPEDALEAFKRKVVADALARRVRFGLDHANMIDFLTNDLGLGAYLPGTKVHVTVEVEVPSGGTAVVREAAIAAVGRGEGTVIGRPVITGY